MIIDGVVESNDAIADLELTADEGTVRVIVEGLCGHDRAALTVIAPGFTTKFTKLEAES